MLHPRHLQLISDSDKELLQLDLRLDIVNFCKVTTDRTWSKVTTCCSRSSSQSTPSSSIFEESDLAGVENYGQQIPLLPSHFVQGQNLITSCRSPCSNSCAAFCAAQTQSHFEPTLPLGLSLRSILQHRLLCKTTEQLLFGSNKEKHLIFIMATTFSQHWIHTCLYYGEASTLVEYQTSHSSHRS